MQTMVKVGVGSTVRYISPGGRRYTVQILSIAKDDLGRGIATIEGYMEGRKERMTVWFSDLMAIRA